MGLRHRVFTHAVVTRRALTQNEGCRVCERERGSGRERGGGVSERERDREREGQREGLCVCDIFPWMWYVARNLHASYIYTHLHIENISIKMLWKVESKTQSKTLPKLTNPKKSIANFAALSSLNFLNSLSFLFANIFGVCCEQFDFILVKHDRNTSHMIWCGLNFVFCDVYVQPCAKANTPTNKLITNSICRLGIHSLVWSGEAP